jgi:hypothetical protein
MPRVCSPTYSPQPESEAHLLPLRASIQGVPGWNVNHSNILRTEKLQSTATRHVVGLACYP